MRQGGSAAVATPLQERHSAAHARSSRPRRRELLVVGLVFLVLWTLFAYYLWSDINRHSDTAALVYMTESTGRFGVPYNQVSISDYDAEAVMPLDPAAACTAPLTPGPESYPNGNFSHFEYHAYYFVYALAPLTWLLPSDVVIGGTQAFAMLAVLLLVYVILRQQRVGIAAAALFCAFIAVYPVWNEALPGTMDLYMDRYFPPLALLFLALAYYGVIAPDQPWARFWPLLIPVGILAASTNDRSMLYVIGASVGIVLMLGRRALGPARVPALALIGLSAFLALAFAVYMTYVHTSDINTIPGFAARISDLIALFASQTPFRFDQTYAELSLKFLLLNLVPFGVWALWRWKLLLLAIAAMLPNVMTSIGGAEKIQFGFHYHAQYLPFIVFAAAVGFATVWNQGALTKAAACVALVGMGVGMLLFDPYQPGLAFTADAADQSGWSNLGGFYLNHNESDVLWRKSLARELDTAVPKGVWVTSSPSYAGALYPGRHWFYYPIAIDSADYAVVEYATAADGSIYYSGANSFLGPEATLQLNQCLTQRLARDGYNVESPQLIGPTLAVLHRSR